MPFELPADGLSGLSDEALSTLLDEGLDAFKDLDLSEDSDEATITEGERIAPLITEIRAEQTARAEAVEARRERARSLVESMTDEPEAEAEAEEPQAEAEETPEAEADDEPVAEVVVEDTQPEPVAASNNDEEALVAEDTQPTEGIAASASPAQRAASNKAPEIVPEKMTAIVAAAADVPGYSNGQKMDGLDEAASAVINRLRGLPRQNLGQVRHRYGAATIRKQGYGNLVQGGEYDDYSLVQAAGRQERLPGGSLVAAGGWCAPSETLYDLCSLETVEGILDIPEFNVSRGGIRYTSGPDFSDIYNTCGFEQDETEAIAGTPKTCCEVTCPTFDEIRLDALGVCIKAPILTNSAYPELVRRFIEGALVAHAHKVNAYIINQMLTAAGTPVVGMATGSLSTAVLSMSLQAQALRYSYRLAPDATIEAVAPVWLREALRMDASMQANRTQPPTDAEIDAAFAAHNIAVQWVYDFQDPTINNGCEVVLPTEVTVIMYPAGTWSKGTQDVINLDAVYDSSGLEENTYTALFVEEGVLAVQRCAHTCALTIPVCISGKKAIDNIDICLTAGTPPTGPT